MTMTYQKTDLKIMIVDDEKLLLQVLEGYLKNFGFQKIIRCKSSQSALRLAKSEQPDLFILDIMMPDMTGGELRERLKEDPGNKNVPVIFISGIISKEEELEMGGRLASGDLIVAKPFSKEKIAKAIDAALSNA